MSKNCHARNPERPTPTEDTKTEARTHKFCHTNSRVKREYVRSKRKKAKDQSNRKKKNFQGHLQLGRELASYVTQHLHTSKNFPRWRNRSNHLVRERRTEKDRGRYNGAVTLRWPVSMPREGEARARRVGKRI